MRGPDMRSRDQLLLEIARSVTGHSLAGTDDLAVLAEVCARVGAAGVPVSRFLIGYDTLHPLAGGRVYTWRRGEGIELDEFGREESGSTAPPWVNSPFHYLMVRGEACVRYRLKELAEFPFPRLAELAAIGLTDYLACMERLGAAVKLGELDCVFSSWGTDAADGFAEEDVALLAALAPYLAASLVAKAVRQITRTVVSTYLGDDAGERVLRGAIARGVADRIRAVVWFSDLKGFTSMVDSVDPGLVLPLLNEYCEPQVTAIAEHGGTVLKFIGDGLLAIFPVGASAADAGKRALAAAEAAFAELAEVSARRADAGLPVTEAYLALHLGEVFYGNIGGADRLDFTVIGPAVNEAARMSAMCRPLGQDILISQALADAVPGLHARLVPLGSHRLRGVAQAQALHGVRRVR